MSWRRSLWCKGVVALSLFALCFVLVVPAMYTMHCVVTDRIRMQWAEARQCQAPALQAYVPEMRVHCFSFSSMVGNIENFTWEAGTPAFVVLAYFMDRAPYVPVRASCTNEVPHYAHGQPVAHWARCLLDSGQLRA